MSVIDAATATATVRPSTTVDASRAPVDPVPGNALGLVALLALWLLGCLATALILATTFPAWLPVGP